MLRLNTILAFFTLFMLSNLVLLGWFLPPGALMTKMLLLLLLGISALGLAIRPRFGAGTMPTQVQKLWAGCCLLLLTGLCYVLDILLSLRVAFLPGFRPMPPLFWWLHVALCLTVLGGFATNALLRIFAASNQLTVKNRALLILLGWVPLVNLAVIFPVFFAAWRECQTLRRRHLRNEARKSDQVCKTRYPLFMVHGIFFRDWERFGYWGRITGELEKNGARVFYGDHQSSGAVPESARELKKTLLFALEESGAEKVNVIAHSKGGLDMRYAISALGLAPHVASLTTINTPHKGSCLAKKALDSIPHKALTLISKEYDKIFTHLGDDQPDFYSGVGELTAEAVEALDAQMPDMPGVFYQSVGSYMRNAQSASFPLDVSFRIIDSIAGSNDGLVAVPSMEHGPFRLVEPGGKVGISHGDMIDLTRKDLPGFDVCELYVEIVADLKGRGF